MVSGFGSEDAGRWRGFEDAWRWVLRTLGTVMRASVLRASGLIKGFWFLVSGLKTLGTSGSLAVLGRRRVSVGG